jgi:hypothetical protein
MTDAAPHDRLSQHQELMLRVARNPRVFCCCLCLSRPDRRRARRIFRLTRKITKAWRKEEEARFKVEAEGLTQDRR